MRSSKMLSYLTHDIPSATTMSVPLGSANHQSPYEPFRRKFEINANDQVQVQPDSKYKLRYLCSSHRMLMRSQQLTNAIHVALIGCYAQRSGTVRSLHAQRSSKHTVLRTSGVSAHRMQRELSDDLHAGQVCNTSTGTRGS